MSWLQKLLPPKIKRAASGSARKAVPEGLWSKCQRCETVLYRAELQKNLNVCPKCGNHERIGARERLDLMLDPVMDIWDCAAWPPILAEAGGYYGDWQGNPTIYAGESIGTTNILLPEVLRVINGG